MKEIFKTFIMEIWKVREAKAEGTDRVLGVTLLQQMVGALKELGHEIEFKYLGKIFSLGLKEISNFNFEAALLKSHCHRHFLWKHI